LSEWAVLLVDEVLEIVFASLPQIDGPSVLCREGDHLALNIEAGGVDEGLDGIAVLFKNPSPVSNYVMADRDLNFGIGFCDGHEDIESGMEAQ
jgi:hypothetical protein